MDLLERAKVLLKATKDLLEKQEDSCYVLNLLAETVFYDGVHCDGNCLKDDIGYWFDELEDAQNVSQKWIPVSERLPKAGEYVDDIDDVAKYYLVQNEYGDMLVARYTHSEYWEQIYKMEPIADEIVAWMPLPKPYEEMERKDES